MHILIMPVVRMIFFLLCKIEMPPKAVPLKKETVLLRYETDFSERRSRKCDEEGWRSFLTIPQYLFFPRIILKIESFPAACLKNICGKSHNRTVLSRAPDFRSQSCVRSVRIHQRNPLSLHQNQESDSDSPYSSDRECPCFEAWDNSPHHKWKNGSSHALTVSKKAVWPVPLTVKMPWRNLVPDRRCESHI